MVFWEVSCWLLGHHQNNAIQIQGVTMKRAVFMVSLVGIGLLAGCASVPMTSPTLDSEAKAFTPESGKANIYVDRGGGVGAGVEFQVVLDGRITGSLAPKTFQLLSVSPGEHTLLVQGGENLQQQKPVAEVGKNYFYRVSVHMGWAAARVHLDPMSEVEGRKAVMDSKRAEAVSYQ
jgi:hypothetical protein